MVLEKFQRALARQATTINLLVLFGLVILFMGVLFPFLVERLQALSGGGALLDTLFYYPPEKAMEMIASYGDEGRRHYLWMLVSADLIYPMIYGALLALLLARAAKRLSGRFFWLGHFVWLPCLPLLADYGENAAIGIMLWNYPDTSKILACLASFFTVVKWASLLVVSLLIILSWLTILFRSFRRGAS
ncbi:MAG: hypothetical protein HPY59_09775 [Anaerolineae bacterium]|nr:hypothetical protein [Anaerolineae bacterium]